MLTEDLILRYDWATILIEMTAEYIEGLKSGEMSMDSVDSVVDTLRHAVKKARAEISSHLAENTPSGT